MALFFCTFSTHHLTMLQRFTYYHTNEKPSSLSFTPPPPPRTEIVKGRNDIFCSLGEVGGVGRVAPQRLTIIAAVVQTVLPLKWSRRKRGQGCKILFPVFGGEIATAKIKPVNGFRVEICVSKYSPSIDRLDSRNGWRGADWLWQSDML